MINMSLSVRYEKRNVYEFSAGVRAQQLAMLHFLLMFDSHRDEDSIGWFLKKRRQCQEFLKIVDIRFVDLLVLQTGLVCRPFLLAQGQRDTPMIPCQICVRCGGQWQLYARW